MKKILNAFIEIVLELGFTILAFLIGWGILAISGINIFDGENFEIAVLIGAVIFIAVFIIAAVIINNYKKNH